jgi:hypothetical protein
MAEVLDEDLPPRRGRRPEYPWDEWLDGRTWLLKAGEDFAVPATSMRVMIYQKAYKRHLKVTTELHGPVGAEDIKIRAYTPDAEVAG